MRCNGRAVDVGVHASFTRRHDRLRLVFSSASETPPNAEQGQPDVLEERKAIIDAFLRRLSDKNARRTSFGQIVR